MVILQTSGWGLGTQLSSRVEGIPFYPGPTGAKLGWRELISFPHSLIPMGRVAGCVSMELEDKGSLDRDVGSV